MLQIPQGGRGVCNDRSNRGAVSPFSTIAAGGNVSAARAFAYFAQALAKHGFDPVGTASGTVDVLRQNGRIVQLAPQFCCFLTQGLVVVDRRNVCVAFFAVQPTAADHAADSGSLHCQSLPSFVRQRTGSQSICASTARRVLFLLCAQPWQPRSSQSPKSSAQAMRVASSLPSSVRGFSAAPRSTGLGLGPRSGFWGAW